MNGIEAGIDPLNWTVGVSFGDPANSTAYTAMFVLGPLYMILWPTR